MMLDESRTPGKTHSEISVEDLRSFVSDFPALLWRIEITRSRIEFLNNHTMPSLGYDVRSLLKNREFRNGVLLPEDAHLFDGFMEAVKEGRTAATVFRVHNTRNKVVWLKLTGATSSRDSRYFYGYLLDVSDTVKVIRSIVDKDIELQMFIEDTDIPMFLAEADSGKIVSSNTPVRELLGMAEDEMLRASLCDILTSPMLNTAKRVREDIPFSKKWAGRMEFRLVGGGAAVADTTIRYLVYKERKLIRVSLVNPELIIPETPKKKSGKHESGLQLRLNGQNDMAKIMRIAMETEGIKGKYDGIMFSDVQSRSNKVKVYAAGTPFAEVEPGETYPYKGTIAEDIERYSLDHMVVDDTEDSIKPIDWSLFVPKGIRSYFAKPYYVRGALRTVLILCSLTPGRFSGKGEADYDHIFDPLAESAKNWRRFLRKKK